VAARGRRMEPTPAKQEPYPALGMAVRKAPVERRKRDRAGKQRALMMAALHLFAAKGFEATSTREIAAAAGCAEGLIHRYFKGKAGLLPALIEQRTSEEMADLGRSLPAAATLEAEFLQMVEWEVEYMWNNREYLRVFVPRSMVDAEVQAVLHRAVLGVRVGKVIERLRRHPGAENLSQGEMEALAQSVGLLGFTFGFLRPVVLGQERSAACQMATCIAKMIICRNAR